MPKLYDTSQCLCDEDFKCYLHAGDNAATTTSVDFGTTKRDHKASQAASSNAPKNGFVDGIAIAVAGPDQSVPVRVGDANQQQQQQASLSFPPYHPIYSKAASYHYGKAAHAKEFADVRQMESTLYKLLTDFHQGHLHAFGEGVTFENMIKVREQQENLARLHFELNAQQSNKQSLEQDFFNEHTITGVGVMSKPFSKSNMLKLIQNLQNLCKSIERLQCKNSNELEFD